MACTINDWACLRDWQKMSLGMVATNKQKRKRMIQCLKEYKSISDEHKARRLNSNSTYFQGLLLNGRWKEAVEFATLVHSKENENTNIDCSKIYWCMCRWFLHSSLGFLGFWVNRFVSSHAKDVYAILKASGGITREMFLMNIQIKFRNEFPEPYIFSILQHSDALDCLLEINDYDIPWSTSNNQTNETLLSRLMFKNQLPSKTIIKLIPLLSDEALNLIPYNSRYAPLIWAFRFGDLNVVGSIFDRIPCINLFAKRIENQNISIFDDIDQELQKEIAWEKSKVFRKQDPLRLHTIELIKTMEYRLKITKDALKKNQMYKDKYSEAIQTLFPCVLVRFIVEFLGWF